MKIHIGPYRKFIGSYQIAELLNKVGVSDETCDKFGEWLASTKLHTFFNWIDGKKKRKVKIHIDNYDTWSMDHTLALIIHPMLVKLKEKKHGSPFVDDEDVPVELRSTSSKPFEKDFDTDEFYHDRWNYVLDEMIWAFEQKNSDWEDQFYSGTHDIVFEPIVGTETSEMKKGPNDTFKIDNEGIQKYQKRISNGFRLFGKYYEGLWN
jgi:hypothetical protein